MKRAHKVFRERIPGRPGQLARDAVLNSHVIVGWKRAKKGIRSSGRRRSIRRPGTMGRYPCVCAYRRYLKGARARLLDSTIRERERKLHFLSNLINRLKKAGKISTANPTGFTQDDILEIFLALKDRNLACSTLRKHVILLKLVARECGNRTVDEMLERGKIVIGNTRQEPFSLSKEDLENLMKACEQVGGWRGDACRFIIAMLTFLRLRPGELRTASIGDLDMNKWTFLVANPKGKGRYAEVKRLPIPDILRSFVLDYLRARESMLRAKGIEHATPLIPALSNKGVNHYVQQSFGSLKKEIVRASGISFKWKDFRPTGGQLALDAGVPIDQVSQSMRHASTVTTERYYCRTRAESAFAHVNEAYNRIFVHEPAISAENDIIEIRK